MESHLDLDTQFPLVTCLGFNTHFFQNYLRLVLVSVEFVCVSCGSRDGFIVSRPVLKTLFYFQILSCEICSFREIVFRVILVSSCSCKVFHKTKTIVSDKTLLGRLAVLAAGKHCPPYSRCRREAIRADQLAG